MKCRFLLAIPLLLAFWPMSVSALDCTPGHGCTTVITSTSASCTLSACLQTPLGPATASATVTVTGTFNATLAFEQSANNGVTWASASGAPQPSGSLATSTTTTGTWVFNLGSRTNFRVRASAYATGRPEVTVTLSNAPSAIVSTSTLAGLGTPANGTVIYCTNCDTPASPGATCSATGDTAGAEAHRIRGGWNCF